MKTDDLIDLMAQEQQRELTPMRSLALSALVAVSISAVLLVSLWGVRSDIAQVVIEPLVLIKYLLPAVTALPCLWLLQRARHPETSLDGSLHWGLLPLFVALALIVSSLYALPTEAWLPTIVGTSLFACLSSIPALGTPILFIILWALKQGAPSHPVLTGALAGVAAGCLATAVYALHCHEDNPAFYGIWYTAGVVLMGLIGQRLGSRLLSW